jgi:hypothetical protein
MEQTTPQPTQPGQAGTGTIRRAATAAPPVIRTRPEQPLPRVGGPSSLMRMLEGAQTYILSEETLILIEFLAVIAIGIIAFRIVLLPVENLLNALGHAISNLGITKLLK